VWLRAILSSSLTVVAGAIWSANINYFWFIFRCKCTIWHHLSPFLRNTFLPVLSPVHPANRRFCTFGVRYITGKYAVVAAHIYLEIDMEMKRRMIEKVNAPIFNNRPPWHKPGVIEWLNTLGEIDDLRFWGELRFGWVRISPGREI
jgi:hypothetical protein